MNKNHNGGRLDKYTNQKIYIVQKTLSNGNIKILNTHSNKTTSLPPSHLKKYNPPQLTMFPQSPSKRTTIPTNQIPTLATDVPISSPWKKIIHPNNPNLTHYMKNPSNHA